VPIIDDKQQVCAYLQPFSR